MISTIKKEPAVLNKTKKILDANITVEDLECLTLVEVAERLIYDEDTLNAVCSQMRLEVFSICGDINWSEAEGRLTPEQRLSIWEMASNLV